MTLWEKAKTKFKKDSTLVLLSPDAAGRDMDIDVAKRQFSIVATTLVEVCRACVISITSKASKSEMIKQVLRKKFDLLEPQMALLGLNSTDQHDPLVS